MDRTRTLDPTECEQTIRQLNGTDNPQLNSFEYSSPFTFEDSQKQRLLETKQPPFRIFKPFQT